MSLRSELDKERASTLEQLEEEKKRVFSRLSDAEEAFRRKRDDWETERRYEQEELHRARVAVEDDAAVARREKDAAKDLVNKVEGELRVMREESKVRRETETDLAARLASVAEREKANEKWREKVETDAARAAEEKEKVLQEWENRVRSERDESRSIRDAVKKER